MSISDKLTTIRNAIKAIKQAIINKGQTPSGDITTYPDAIGNITSGTTINNQNKTITSNGSYTADEGYTGLGTVTVNTPVIKNQEKTATSNGVVTPDTGYTGLSKVTVNTPAIKNQSKTVTENDTVTPDGGYTGLSDVTVNVPTGITPSGTISITENGTHDVTNYANANVNIPSIQYIPREVTSDGVLQPISTKFTFSLPSNVTSIGVHALKHALAQNNELASVDLSNITSVAFQGLYSAFNSCKGLTSVNLSGLIRIDNQGLYTAFSAATRLNSVDLSSVVSIGYGGLYRAFQDNALSSLSFPSLTSTSFGSATNPFNYMLGGVTGCTVHFPSNLESVIGSWSDVTSGFGGKNTVVLFDLPATS